MKRKALFCSILFVALFGLSVGFAVGHEVNLGPEDIIMKTKEAKKPAEFPHRFHQEVMGCMSCHHAKGQIVTIKKCATCHNEEMENEKLNNLKLAGHALCRGCHKEVNAAGKEAPKKCSGCHPLKIRN